MGFTIVVGNILEQRVDAIVNSTNSRYSGGGRGVDNQIHLAEGQDLVDKTSKLTRLHLGEAKHTQASVLPCKYIIHTAGPTWTGSSWLEISLLGSCYRNSIALARSLGCRSIAFPLICAKANRYPKEVALSVAVDAIRESLTCNDDIEVRLVLYSENSDPRMQAVAEQIGLDIEQNFISPEYVVEQQSSRRLRTMTERQTERNPEREPEAEAGNPEYSGIVEETGICKESEIRFRAEICTEPEIGSEPVQDGRLYSLHMPYGELDDLISNLIKNPTDKNLQAIKLEDDFATTLKKHIQNSGQTNLSSIYMQLDMSKTGFWKIMNGKSNPSKITVFALAITLHLNLDQTTDMLMKAGYAINRSSLQDLVLASFIKNGNYDRYLIDDTLYSLDLNTLPGSVVE